MKVAELSLPTKFCPIGTDTWAYPATMETNRNRINENIPEPGLLLPGFVTAYELVTNLGLSNLPFNRCRPEFAWRAVPLGGTAWNRVNAVLPT
jgi:hypothetical protein